METINSLKDVDEMKRNKIIGNVEIKERGEERREIG